MFSDSESTFSPQNDTGKYNCKYTTVNQEIKQRRRGKYRPTNLFAVLGALCEHPLNGVLRFSKL